MSSFYALQPIQIVGRLLRLTGRGRESQLVALQQRELAFQVHRFVRGRLVAEVEADLPESRAESGGQRPHRLGRAAKAALNTLAARRSVQCENSCSKVRNRWLNVYTIDPITAKLGKLADRRDGLFVFTPTQDLVKLDVRRPSTNVRAC